MIDIDCLLANCHYSPIILTNTHFSQPRGLDLHMIAHHQFLGIWMQIHLLVHPAGNGIPIHGLEQPMLGPVCSYVSDTIGGSNPCL